MLEMCISITGPSKEISESGYEVRSGMQLFWMSADAYRVVTGDVIRLSDELNHWQTRIDQFQWNRASEIPESDMIVYERPVDAIGEITVFTDTSCGYCRKVSYPRGSPPSRRS